MQKNYLAALATNPNALLSDKNTLGSPRAGGGSPRSGTRRRSKSRGSKGGNSPRNAQNSVAAADVGNQGFQEEEKKHEVMQEIFHEIRRPDPQPLPQEPDVSVGILKSDTFMRKEFEHAEEAHLQEIEYRKVDHRIGRTDQRVEAAQHISEEEQARMEAERLALAATHDPCANTMENIQNIADTRYEQAFHQPASAGSIITDVRAGDFAHHKRYE